MPKERKVSEQVLGKFPQVQNKPIFTVLTFSREMIYIFLKSSQIPKLDHFHLFSTLKIYFWERLIQIHILAVHYKASLERCMPKERKVSEQVLRKFPPSAK